jgi:hypothetical protein
VVTNVLEEFIASTLKMDAIGSSEKPLIACKTAGPHAEERNSNLLTAVKTSNLI